MVEGFRIWSLELQVQDFKFAPHGLSLGLRIQSFGLGFQVWAYGVSIGAGVMGWE